MNINHNKKAMSRDVKHSISLLLGSDPPTNPQNPLDQHLRVLSLPSTNIKKELEILCWRFKTYLPIVKPLEYVVNPSTEGGAFQKGKGMATLEQYQPGFSPSKYNQKPSMLLNKPILQDKERCELRVRIQETKCRLSDIDMLSFSQILYLLKEMVIGYDALIDIFGTFEPREQMVAVNASYQWKVWISHNFFTSTKEEPQSPIGQREFIYKLLILSQSKCQGTSLSKIFFKDMKGYTYNQDCGFIKMLERIKEFIKVNRIFQVNKVTLPWEKIQKSLNLQSVNFKSATNLNATACFGATNKGGMGKLRMQKKQSLTFQHGEMQSSAFLNKTTINGLPKMGKVSQMGASRQLQPQHCQSQKMFFYPSNNGLVSNCQSPAVSLQNEKQRGSKGFGQFVEKWNSNSNFMHKNKNHRMNKGITSSYLPASQVVGNSVNASIQASQPLKTYNNQGHLDKNTTAFGQMTKSRHQLKQLVNHRAPIIKSNQPAIPGHSKSKKNQRKYSEQVFKAKSVDALAVVRERVRASQFYYEQDPETKQEVNVIKKNVPQHEPEVVCSPRKEIKNYPSSKRTTVKDPGSTTPKNSSNSQNSSDPIKKGASYQYLKVNDLHSNKIRNNQSSYYGMGGYQPKRDKNMTISYQFKNRNQMQSKSSASVEKVDNNQSGKQSEGYNWTKKLSGLFSDDASIKQLKKSVKFKTAEEEYFQKQYLKDIKLQMLQKFGRPVRHSIVDEDDDGRGPIKNTLNSMQLIEQVADQGKSCMQKQQEIIVQEQEPVTRCRNRTVQIVRDPPQIKKIQEKHCISFEVYSNSGSEVEQDCFNFEPQEYVLNRK